jgi:hypothetical protein
MGRYSPEARPRAFGEIGAWAAVACVVWLVTLSSVTLPELCFAIAASIPCGVLARASRRSLGASWRFSPRWLAWPAPVTASLVAELVELWRSALGHPRPGRLTSVDLPDEEPPLAAGREAVAILALSSTPGRVVADSDPEQHRLTVHTLLSAGPDLTSVVKR